MTVRAVLIVLLALMAGCSAEPNKHSPVASGCAATLEGSDAAACWLWSDAISRASTPGQSAADKPLLRDSGGGVIVGTRPTN